MIKTKSLTAPCVQIKSWILFECTFWMCRQVHIILMPDSVYCVVSYILNVGSSISNLRQQQTSQISRRSRIFANLSDSCRWHIWPGWLIKLMVAEITVSGHLVPNVLNEYCILSTSAKDVMLSPVSICLLVCQQEEQVWFLQQLLFCVFIVHSIIISHYSSFSIVSCPATLKLHLLKWFIPLYFLSLFSSHWYQRHSWVFTRRMSPC